MRNQLLHVYRNTPFGRETLLQSIYFSKQVGVSLRVYIPRFRQFLLYFENQVVTVDLDSAFLFSPKTARPHAEAIIREAGLTPQFFEPKAFTASTLPDLPVDFKYMCCPRSISDLSSKIGLGYIGPRVRAVIKNASFPVLIPTPVYKEWKKITIFYGGSANAGKAARTAVEISRQTGFPLLVFTQAEGKPQSYYELSLKERGIWNDLEDLHFDWIFHEKGRFRENLFDVPHDSLVVVGAYGHGAIREVLFGSMMEEIQSTLPNSMLIVGPRVRTAGES